MNNARKFLTTGLIAAVLAAGIASTSPAFAFRGGGRGGGWGHGGMAMHGGWGRGGWAHGGWGRGGLGYAGYGRGWRRGGLAYAGYGGWGGGWGGDWGYGWDYPYAYDVGWGGGCPCAGGYYGAGYYGAGVAGAAWSGGAWSGRGRLRLRPRLVVERGAPASERRRTPWKPSKTSPRPRGEARRGALVVAEGDR